MVGAMLSRVLPIRNKMASRFVNHEVIDEKADHTHHQLSKTNDSEPRINHVGVKGEPRISFNARVNNKSPTRIAIMPISPRKDSYASIKEDSDIPQSFRSRRLGSELGRKLSQGSSRRSSLDMQMTLGDVECLEDDEIAITDEEQAEIGSLRRSESPSHDSILSVSRPQPASFENMPDEILDLIFSLITLDGAKDRYADPKVDLFACLQVSKTIHAAALRVLYRHVKIPQSKAFSKFSKSLTEDVHLGELVQCLDFSHYSSIGFGRTRTTHTQTPYLTPFTLKACLDMTTKLKAFLVHEHIDDELDINVLSKLFSMSSLRALDLCACSSKPFTEAFTTFCANIDPQLRLNNPSSFLNIERLSLHECGTLRPQAFEALLPRLARLTHLDVAHTMINDVALLSIPTSARITHLNLERCTQVTGAAAVKFLTTHPAVMDSAVYLNLMADASRYRLLDEDDLHTLLPNLPHTLRSLNIGGARVNSSHMPHLRALATHLEELGLKGANLSLGGDIAQILSLVLASSEGEVEYLERRSTLRYVDLTDVKSVSKMSLTYSPTTIIGNESVPLEVIELGSTVFSDIEKSVRRQKNPEWIVRELGRRGWYVRQTNLLPKWLHTPDDGHRKWKMGARWWGMRKIPMFEQDTGGMYGYYMFKRN